MISNKNNYENTEKNFVQAETYYLCYLLLKKTIRIFENVFLVSNETGKENENET